MKSDEYGFFKTFITLKWHKIRLFVYNYKYVSYLLWVICLKSSDWLTIKNIWLGS